MIEPSIVISPVGPLALLRVEAVPHDCVVSRPEAAGFFLQSASTRQEKAQKTYQNTSENLEEHRGEIGSAKQIRNVQTMTVEIRDQLGRMARVIAPVAVVTTEGR